MHTKLDVKLLSYTPEPEKLVSAAAKLCYSDLSGKDLMDGLDKEKTERFIEKLTNLGHESPLEHISFSFSIEGVSRVLTHQLVRHRIASYSQRSQRYVKEGQFDYIVPPVLNGDYEAKKIYIEQMVKAQEAYDKLADMLYKKYLPKYSEDFGKYISKFEKEKKIKKDKEKAEKKAIEDARYVLPNACETKIMVTMNARTLLHFFNLRCCNRAQWEIRQMAEKMLEQVKEVAPILFKNAGPRCLNGHCPEGNMTCGEIGDVRKKYELL
jgi:thymidylate synthase (FAD)